MIVEEVVVVVVVAVVAEDNATEKKGNGMCSKEMRAKNRAKNCATC
jgi:hypothetical protein